MQISEILKYIILSFIPIGLIFIIINGLINTMNIKKRAVLNLIIGLSLFLIFSASTLIDFFLLKEKKLINKLYFTFPIVILVFTISISVYLFHYAKKYNIRIQPKMRYVKIKEEEVLKRDETKSFKLDLKLENLIYIVFQFDDLLYLSNIDYSLSGYKELIQEELPKGQIKKIVSKFELDYKDINYIGNYTDHQKSLYCYLINLNKENINLNFLKPVNKYYLDQESLFGLDKEIVLRILLKESFNIKKD